jgi:site-specific recombinase XerD
MRLMAHVSRWLAERGGEPSALTPQAVEQFLDARRVGYVRLTSRRALVPLLDYLRGLGVMPEPDPPIVDTPVERLVAGYRDWLVRERGLAAGSVRLRERVARLFLSERSEPIDLALQRLQPAEVTAFVAAQCRSGRRGVSSAKTLTSGLRSLLGFLHVTGWVPVPLAQAVPSVAGWRLGSLPRALEPEQVARLLASCEPATPVGCRDLAILTLLSRLGLRAFEVAGLSLDDIDWRASELTVGGKGSRTERLPLPHDVGETLVGYLCAGRPPASCRAVFVRARAPHGAISAAAVRSVVHHACDRAGVPRVGAHRLRHTVATEMLRAGAPPAQIAQVLRHASLASTAIYAKVDRVALRTLARPWPFAEGAA